MIRHLEGDDLPFLKIIHEKYYKEEFPFPDFRSFLAAFTIIRSGEIIVAGGIKTILEVVAITDKSKGVRLRRNSLLELFHTLSLAANNYRFDQMHTTIIEDRDWENHLKRVGFKPVKGEVLVVDI